MEDDKIIYLIIGSYCEKDEEGIKIYKFDQTTGDYEYTTGLKGILNPSFIFPSKRGDKIYSVGEADLENSTCNFISFDKNSEKLSLKGTEKTEGAAPCNVILSHDEKYAYTANYNGGSVTQFELDEDGCLKRRAVLPFTGSSIIKDRQEQAHIHAVNYTPDNKYMLINDLGADKIYMIPNDTLSDIKSAQISEVKLKEGSGPRHLAFANNGKFCYLISELSDEICVLEYKAGTLTMKQSIKLHDGRGSADVHVSKDGRYLYASHRLKDDGISILKILENGTVEKVGFVSTGMHPRNFVITPNDKFLLCACRDSNNVQIFKREENGTLTCTGKEIRMDKPVCLQFTSIVNKY